MKIVVEEKPDSMITLYINPQGKSLEEVEDDIFNIEIDDMDYYTIWNDVCSSIFGSWLIRSKKIQAHAYTIFYPLSKIKVIARLQLNLFHITAEIANWEMDRVYNIYKGWNKEKGNFGKQIDMDLE